MKAKIRALIILSILCVFLASAYALLPSGQASAAGRGAANFGIPLIITDFHVSELLALALSNSRGPFGILNNPQGITAVSDVDGYFSAAQMRAFVYVVCNLRGTRRLDILPEPEEIANSLAHFSLILTGYREYRFALLRRSPVSDEYLLFSQEHQAIFLVSEPTAQWFLRGAGDFME